jgi:hypothetical protein
MAPAEAGGCPNRGDQGIPGNPRAAGPPLSGDPSDPAGEGDQSRAPATLAPGLALGVSGQPVEIIGKVNEFVACVAKPHLSRQVPQDLSRAPVFLRLRGRREIFDHVDFPPIGLIGSKNAVEGFEFRPAAAGGYHAAPRRASRSREPWKGTLGLQLERVRAAQARGTRVEVWFADEARIGQKNSLTRVVLHPRSAGLDVHRRNRGEFHYLHAIRVRFQPSELAARGPPTW